MWIILTIAATNRPQLFNTEHITMIGVSSSGQGSTVEIVNDNTTDVIVKESLKEIHEKMRDMEPAGIEDWPAEDNEEEEDEEGPLDNPRSWACGEKEIDNTAEAADLAEALGAESVLRGAGQSTKASSLPNLLDDLVTLRNALDSKAHFGTATYAAYLDAIELVTILIAKHDKPENWAVPFTKPPKEAALRQQIIKDLEELWDSVGLQIIKLRDEYRK